MKTLQVGEFKGRFSEVLEDIRQGNEVAITYGKKKDKIAVLVPFSVYKNQKKVKLGLLKGKGKLVISDHFKITDDELLGQ